MLMLKILLLNPIFLLPKFLELFFTPKNTPSKVKNSIMGLNHIFFGTPCRKIFSNNIHTCSCIWPSVELVEWKLLQDISNILINTIKLCFLYQEISHLISHDYIMHRKSDCWLLFISSKLYCLPTLFESFWTIKCSSQVSS